VVVGLVFPQISRISQISFLGGGGWVEVVGLRWGVVFADLFWVDGWFGWWS